MPEFPGCPPEANRTTPTFPARWNAIGVQFGEHVEANCDGQPSVAEGVGASSVMTAGADDEVATQADRIADAAAARQMATARRAPVFP